MFELPHHVMASQHALITTAQLRASGFDREGEKWLVRTGWLEPVSRRVLRLAGAPATEAQRLLAAVLDAGPGSALSHTSALAWWKVPGFTLRELHVTRSRDGTRPSRYLAHSLHDGVPLPEHHVRVLEGIPVVTPARALFDLAGMPRVPRVRVERAVDNAWSLRLVSGATLRAMLRHLTRPGRSGIATMRELLAERRGDYVPPASGLESRVAEILKGRWRTALRRQVQVGDEDQWIGRIDFADPELPFLLEVQSERFHASLLDRRADTERRARLEAAGFVVVAVSDMDVWHHPDGVVDKVREGRNEANLRVLRGEVATRPEAVGATP
jgi:very-short-patch-repair endonuclease